MNHGITVSALRLGMGMMLLLASSGVLAHGTHSRLLAHVDAALAKQPENGGLWYRRAQLDFEHEDLAESLLDLEKTAQFAPGQFPVLWLKGRVLDAAGNYEEALSALDAFIAGAPKHWGALASRARVEGKLGRNEDAVDDFKSALANHPDAGPDLIQEVAEALAAHGLTDESVRVLENGLARLSRISSLQIKLIEIEMSAARYDSALARLNDFQQSAPRPEPWMAKRAGLLAGAGRFAESRAAWQSVISHLRQLPDGERNSHAMTLLDEQAHEALLILSLTDSAKTLCQ